MDRRERTRPTSRSSRPCERCHVPKFPQIKQAHFKLIVHQNACRVSFNVNNGELTFTNCYLFKLFLFALYKPRVRYEGVAPLQKKIADDAILNGKTVQFFL